MPPLQVLALRAFTSVEDVGNGKALEEALNTAERIEQKFMKENAAAEKMRRELEFIKSLRPNSMNKHGVVLAGIGMSKAMDHFVEFYLFPIAAALFGLPSVEEGGGAVAVARRTATATAAAVAGGTETLRAPSSLGGAAAKAASATAQRKRFRPNPPQNLIGVGASLDQQHSFLVKYEAREGKDHGLDMHTDDSEVTFNIALSKVERDEQKAHGKERKCSASHLKTSERPQASFYTGGHLDFCGYMGGEYHRQHSRKYEHRLGWAVVHRGRHRHGAADIQSGERVNLIVWCRSWAWRLAHALRGGDLGDGQYAREAAPPDRVCLSSTHDRDFLKRAAEDDPRRKRLARTDLERKTRQWCPPPGREYKGFS